MIQRGITKLSNKTLGDEGEHLAANYLIGLGYQIMARNFRIRAAELDLVAKDGDTIAFVEVKTRRSTRFGTGAEAVNGRKQQKIIQAARYFLQQRHLEGAPCRFEVIEIYAEKGGTPVLHHIKGAFET